MLNSRIFHLVNFYEYIIEAIKQIKQKNKQLPIIVQTAFALSNEREECFKAGCSDYINKPYSKQEILLKINKFIMA
jgi:CheY-like chemotaxis protein